MIDDIRLYNIILYTNVRNIVVVLSGSVEKNDPPTGNSINIRCKTALACAIIRVIHTRVLCVCKYIYIYKIYNIYIILYASAYGVRLTISFSYEARGGCPFQGLHSLHTPLSALKKIKN